MAFAWCAPESKVRFYLYSLAMLAPDSCLFVKNQHWPGKERKAHAKATTRALKSAQLELDISSQGGLQSALA